MTNNAKAAASNATKAANRAAKLAAASILSPLNIATVALLDSLAAADEATRGKYEALNKEMELAYGIGWPNFTFHSRTLTDEERAIKAGIAAVKASLKTGCAERDISFSAAWQNLKLWGQGLRGKKAATGKPANAKRPFGPFLDDILPQIYKRGMKEEDITERDLDHTFQIGRMLESRGFDLSTFTT